MVVGAKRRMLRMCPSPKRSWIFRLNCCILLMAITAVSGDSQSSTLQLSPPRVNNNGLAAAELNDERTKEKKKKKTNKQDRIFALLGVSRLSSQNRRRPLRTNAPLACSRRHHGSILRKIRCGGGANDAAAAAAAAAPPPGGDKSTVSNSNSTDSTTTSSSPSPFSAKWIDDQARSITLAFAWVVSAQVVGTTLHSFREPVLQFASRFVKHDTLSAARSIRQILDSMDDHGIVDLLAHHEPKQILVSIYALSKLQAACQLHQRRPTTSTRTKRSKKQDTTNDADLTPLLQDLYDCLPFATAAYGWKFNLATSGKFHKGDMEALVKMTQVDPSDIVTVNWEARPNRPAFYVVRDCKRKRIVLGIRGTWSAQDLMTDLCCTTEDYYASSSAGNNSRRGKALRAHSGMLTAARGVALLAEDLIAQELDDHADYSLLLVGHSLGGSAAAVLGTLWAERFPRSNVAVYAYGPACVFPESFHDDYKGANIVSVLLDGDPFSCLSLGHVADVSGALDYLCEDTDLRKQIVVHTSDKLKHISSRDLEWCSRSMADIKRGLTLTEKLYPPGKLLFVHKKCKHNSKQADCSVQDVAPSFFQYWKLGPRMFDLTRHSPKVYETSLRKAIARAKHHRFTTAKNNQ